MLFNRLAVLSSIVFSVLSLSSCGKNTNNNAQLSTIISTQNTWFSKQITYLWPYDMVKIDPSTTDADKAKGDYYLMSTGKKKIYQCWYEGSTSVSEADAFSKAVQISNSYVWQRSVASEIIGKMEANASLSEAKTQVIDDLLQRAHDVGCPLSTLISEFALVASMILAKEELSYKDMEDLVKAVSQDNPAVLETCRMWLSKVSHGWQFAKDLNNKLDKTRSTEQKYSLELYRKLQQDMNTTSVEVVPPEVGNLIREVIKESSALAPYACPSISKLKIVDGGLQKK